MTIYAQNKIRISFAMLWYTYHMNQTTYRVLFNLYTDTSVHECLPETNFLFR